MLIGRPMISALGAALALVVASCGAGASPPSSSPTPASGASQAQPSSSAAGVSAPAKAAYKLQIPYTAPSGSFTPLWVAADEGIFEKHGIDATVSYMDTNASSSAFVAGELNVNLVPQLLNFMLGGGDAIFVARLTLAPVMSIYGAPGVSSLAAIKGKIMADTPEGSSPDIILRELLTRHSIAPDKDVTFVHSPNPGTELAAMQAHQAAAGILSPPITLKAKQAGFTELADAAKEGIPTIAPALSVRKSWLGQNRAEVQALLESLTDAEAWARANPAKTKAIIGKYTKTADTGVLDETYQAYQAYWAVAPIRPEDIALFLKYAAAANAATAKPTGFYDNSVVQSLR